MKRILYVILLFAAVFCFGCSQDNSEKKTSAEQNNITDTSAEDNGQTENKAPEATSAPISTPAPIPAIPVVLECTAPGTAEERCDVAVVDYSNSADGYIMVQFFGQTSNRLKVRVAGKTTYTYNLTADSWAVLPLSDGDGSYKVTVYEGVGGNKYATVMSAAFDAVITDEFATFLRPNQYVDYSGANSTLALGQELCTGVEGTLNKVAAVYDYIVDNFTYDYDKAASVQSGYLPDIDKVLAEKKGICFDYAAVMTAIMRSQEIPCQLVVGYAGDIYHAWINVWTEENGWVDGVIFFDGHEWRRMDPTFASSSNRSDDIMQFIESDAYIIKYLY